MDPYVKIEINGETKKTKVLEEAGAKPEWNETIEFENVNATDTAKLTVLDEDNGSDDVVGEISYTIEKLIKLHQSGISYNSKSAGILYMKSNLVGFQPLGLVKPQIQSFTYHPLADAQSADSLKISDDAKATLDKAPDFAYRKAPGAVKPKGSSN